MGMMIPSPVFASPLVSLGHSSADMADGGADDIGLAGVAGDLEGTFLTEFETAGDRLPVTSSVSTVFATGASAALGDDSWLSFCAGLVLGAACLAAWMAAAISPASAAGNPMTVLVRSPARGVAVSGVVKTALAGFVFAVDGAVFALAKFAIGVVFAAGEGVCGG